MRYWDLFGREGGGRAGKWRTPAGEDAAGVLLFVVATRQMVRAWGNRKTGGRIRSSAMPDFGGHGICGISWSR